MKKLFLITSFILALGATLLAQDCATGYCPATITVHHKAGSVSPITANITYEVIKISVSSTTNKCFITRNLGATSAPANYSTPSYASNGWYWQYNRKQGYYIGASSTFVLTPSIAAGGWLTSNSESSNWTAANDPCTLTLGASWRLPTVAEWAYCASPGLISVTYHWTNVIASNSAPLKLNDAGLVEVNGATMNAGPGTGKVYLWAGDGGNASPYTTAGAIFYNSLSATGSVMQAVTKTAGLPVRCLRTY